MSIPPSIVAMARASWKWQWLQLMNGLGPSDQNGNYVRPKSEYQKGLMPTLNNLQNRSADLLPRLVIGRSCPWAHRTWLIHVLRKLGPSLNLLIAKADHKGGRWSIEPPWLGCSSLLNLYMACGKSPSYRATVPTLIDPGSNASDPPQILCNESSVLVEMLNEWPTTEESVLDFCPEELKQEIDNWQNLLQPKVNDGVYRCGFARSQEAYDHATSELFSALKVVEKNLSQKGPWLCGAQLTLADIRLFPTLIRWESVYAPLFGCNKEPLWAYPNIWSWRRKLFNIQGVCKTCDPIAWRNDYFGALFPLHPSNIIHSGPELTKMINAKAPILDE